MEGLTIGDSYGMVNLPWNQGLDISSTIKVPAVEEIVLDSNTWPMNDRLAKCYGPPLIIKRPRKWWTMGMIVKQFTIRLVN